MMLSTISYTVDGNNYYDVYSALLAAQCNAEAVTVNTKPSVAMDMSEVDEVLSVMLLLCPDSLFNIYRRKERFDVENVLIADSLLADHLSYAETVKWLLSYIPYLAVPMGVKREGNEVEFIFTFDHLPERGYDDIVIKPTT